MSEVKWIKITTNMFDDEKIKLIEQLPEADSILIIWIKLLVQAGKTNASGYIYLTENIPYTDEMLSAIFNRPINIVRLALKTFNDFGMIILEKGKMIKIENWEKHQNIEGMEKIKEQNKIRKQKQREREKQLLLKKEKSHVTSRDSHATEEEGEREEEKEREKEEEATKCSSIFKFYEQNFGKTISPHIAEKIKAFLEEYSFDLLAKAMQITIERGKNSINYTEGILKSWESKGIQTIDAVEGEQKIKNSQKQSSGNIFFDIANESGEGIE